MRGAIVSKWFPIKFWFQPYLRSLYARKLFWLIEFSLQFFNFLWLLARRFHRLRFSFRKEKLAKETNSRPKTTNKKRSTSRVFHAARPVGSKFRLSCNAARPARPRTFIGVQTQGFRIASRYARVSTGLANLWQNFFCHPILKFFSIRLPALKNALVQIWLVYKICNLPPAERIDDVVINDPIFF